MQRQSRKSSGTYECVCVCGGGVRHHRKKYKSDQGRGTRRDECPHKKEDSKKKFTDRWRSIGKFRKKQKRSYQNEPRVQTDENQIATTKERQRDIKTLLQIKQRNKQPPTGSDPSLGGRWSVEIVLHFRTGRMINSVLTAYALTLTSKHTRRSQSDTRHSHL